jgi:cytochrome c553
MKPSTRPSPATLLVLLLLVIVLGLPVAIGLYQAAPAAPAASVAPPPTRSPASVAPGTPTFSQDVRPILTPRCLSCHSARFDAGGFDMESYEAMLTSGHNAPNIVPGDAKSRLLRLLRGEALDGTRPMPPGPPLSADEIAVIEAWIEAGAPE